MENDSVGKGLTCQGTLCDISFMGNIFQSLEKGDCVVGVITQIMESGLVMTILSLDDGKSRDIDNLRISVRPACSIIRDHLIAFWLLPPVSTPGPIISPRALARVLIMVEG